jgi:hypothetical protein
MQHDRTEWTFGATYRTWLVYGVYFKLGRSQLNIYMDMFRRCTLSPLHRQLCTAQPVVSLQSNRVDWSKLPALVEQTRKAGTWNCPTLGHLRSRSLPDIEAAKIRAEKRMRYMPADI